MAFSTTEFTIALLELEANVRKVPHQGLALSAGMLALLLVLLQQIYSTDKSEWMWMHCVKEEKAVDTS